MKSIEKSSRRIWERGLAAVLSLAMILTVIHLSPLGVKADGTTVTTSEVALIVNALEERGAALTQDQVDIAETLDTKTVSYNLPSTIVEDPSEYITIDTETKTVHALNVTDNEGNVWEPVLVEIIGEDGETAEETIGIADNEAVYTFTGEQFEARVKYEMVVMIDSALTDAILALPFDLSSVMNTAVFLNSTVLPSLHSLATRMDTLKDIVDNGISLGAGFTPIRVVDENFINPVNELYRQTQENGGEFDLYVALAYDFTEIYDDDGNVDPAKLADLLVYVFNNAQSIWDKLTATNALLKTMKNSDAWTTISTYAPGDMKETAEAANDVLDGLIENMDAAEAENWQFLYDDDYKATLADVPEETWRGLAAKIYNLDNTATFAGPADLSQIVIADKLSAMVGQKVIKVQVKINAIPKDRIDNNTLKTFTVESSFIVSEAATPDAISEQAALVRDNLLAEAEASSEFTFIADKFTAGEAAVAGDVFTYTYDADTVTYALDGENTEVYCGFNLTLPVNPDEEKVNVYTVVTGDNTTTLEQGTVICITADTTITTKQAKAGTNMGLNILVADGSATLTDDQKELLKNAAIVADQIVLVTPEASDDLVTLSVQEGSLIITAQPFDSGINGVKWIPAWVFIPMSDPEAVPFNIPFEQDGSVYKATAWDTENQIHVCYTLSLPVGPEPITSDKVLDLMNLPQELATALRNQEAAFAKLQSERENFGKFDDRYGDVQTALTTYKNQLSPEAQEAAQTLMTRCVSAGSLRITNILNQVEANGIKYYYTNGTAVKNQVNILNTCLNILAGENSGLYQLLVDKGYESYWSMFEDMAATLAEADALLTPVSEAINTESAALDSLLNTLRALGAADAYAAPDETLNLTAEFDIAPPDRALLKVVINQVDRDGNVVNTEDTTFSFAIGQELTADEITYFNSLIPDAITHFGLDASLFEVTFPEDWPQAGDVMNASKTVTVTIAPKVVTITIEDEEGETVGEVKISGESEASLTITLPGTGSAGLKYHYFIFEDRNGNDGQNGTHAMGTLPSDVSLNATPIPTTATEMVVGAEDVSYRFLALPQNPVRIVRQTENLSGDAIDDLIYNLNQAVINAGYTSSGHGNISLVEGEDGQGNKIIVLRLSPDGRPTQAQIKAVAKKVGRVLSDANIYIGVNGEDAWYTDENGERKASAQALVDAILNSGEGLHTITEAIDKNGHINQLQLEGVTLISNLSNVYLPEQYGGKLIKVTMNAGIDKASALDFEFYVTLDDFGKQTSNLKSARKLALRLKNNLDIYTENGALVVELKNDRAYQAYITAAAGLGYGKLDDLANIDNEGMVDVLWEVFKQLLEDEGMTTATVTNTAQKARVNRDVTEYERYYQWARKAAKHAVRNVTKTLAGDLLYSLDYDMQEAIDYVNGGEYESLLAETTVNGNVQIKLPTKQYQALIIEPRAEGFQKFRYTMDIVSALRGVTKSAYIYLLSDVDGDLTFNNRAILDLNGKNVNGSITSASRALYIADSSLDTASSGRVSGSVSGNVTVLGGAYDANVESKLPKGFIQDGSGIVSNGIYTISYDEDSNTIVFNVNADLINLTERPSLRGLAEEMVYDLVMNDYTNAGLALEGNVLYHMQLDDATSWASRSALNAENAQLLLDTCIDLDGINAAINMVVADFLKFGDLEAAVLADQNLVEYSMTGYKWGFNVYRKTSGNYLTGDVSTNYDHTEDYTVAVKLVGSDESKKLAAEILHLAANVVETAESTTTLSNLKYADHTISIDADEKGKLVLDLTADPEYAIALAIAAAQTADDEQKQALVDAINTYYETERTADLKAALETVSVADTFKALRSFHRSTSFDDMVANLGLDASKLQKIPNYADAFVLILAAGGFGLRQVSNTGRSNTLGEYEQEFGVYSAFNKTYSRSEDITRRGYTALVNGTALAEELTVKIFLPDYIYEITYENGDVVLLTEGDLAELMETDDIVKIKVLKPVELTRDVDLDRELTLEGLEKVDLGEYTITLEETGKLTVDGQLEIEVVILSFDPNAFEVVEEIDGENYIYYLEALDEDYMYHITYANGDELWLVDGDLAYLIANAEDGETIEVLKDVVLESDTAVAEGVNLTVIFDGHVDQNGKSITINKHSSLTSDEAIENTVSGSEWSEVNCEGEYVYTLKALVPEIEDPTADLDDGILLGMSLEATMIGEDEKIIILDVANYEGISEDQAKAHLMFLTRNSSSTQIIYAGAKLNSILPTGATVTVKASNPDYLEEMGEEDGWVEVTYTIIILGDANCNGQVDAGDAVKMARNFTEVEALTGYGLEAADVNRNGEVDTGDAAANARKFTGSGYHTFLTLN